MKFLILLSLVAGSYAQSCVSIASPQHPVEKLSVADAFKKYKIVDDYLPEAPEDLFVGNGIQLGTVFSPMAGVSPENLSYPNGKDGALYTAVLLGIDIKDESGKGAYINGMFVNAPADDITKGDKVVPFSPAVPVPDTGVNRFVGLLYEQNDAFDADSVDMLKLAKNRSGFSAVDFADKYGLGKPVAGNFFLTSLKSCDSQ